MHDKEEVRGKEEKNDWNSQHYPNWPDHVTCLKSVQFFCVCGRVTLLTSFFLVFFLFQLTITSWAGTTETWKCEITRASKEKMRIFQFQVYPNVLQWAHMFFVIVLLYSLKEVQNIYLSFFSGFTKLRWDHIRPYYLTHFLYTMLNLSNQVIK